MSIARFLIFGDLHGRIQPAFRLALRWEREHGVRLDALLQIGDLGYFPDTTRLDNGAPFGAIHFFRDKKDSRPLSASFRPLRQS